MPTIRVDDEVFKELQKRAEPFVDTPNIVIRRLLGIAERVAGPAVDDRTSQTTHQPRRLPMREYEFPLLEALAERGGTAPAKDIVEAVGRKLERRITALDRTTTQSGAIRWQNRAQWMRLRLVERGLLKKNSPWGIWELSDAGRRHIQEGKAS